ncbi:MAG TPA: hypothetical protein VF503_21290 [Sphingobium sp.]|uniref:hypothetical protein n=1 Tax=Sphingobium sp. TaxID=1912891 RepID=UPI002ECFBD62
MTRANIDYAAGGEGTAVAGAYDVTTPTAGFYKMKLRSGGHPVGIKVWFGAPLDPVTGEELDRGHRWQALANDRAIDLDRVWPRAGHEPIDAAEYRYLADLQSWAEKNAPDSPQANPHRRIDPLTSLVPF